MGAGNFNVETYKEQAKEAQVSKNSGFEAKSMCDEFNPARVDIRYSKKGPFNEFREPITVLIGLDVTGSMDVIPKALLTGELGNLMIDLKKKCNKPNENLQISFAGLGDAKTDEAPLQVTHFESDNRFAQQLQKIWLEGHGGGNGGESYNLLWWYAANKTHLNYVKQDGRKGVLITIGDDNVHPNLTASEIQTWLDPKYDGGDISNEVLLAAVREQYDVYHIVITDGQSYSYDVLKQRNKTEAQKKDEVERWAKLLGRSNVIYSHSSGVAKSIAEIVERHRPLQKVNMINLTEKEWEKKNKEDLTDKQWEEVLSYTLCPLTGKYMKNPVELGNSKRVYEKEAIEKYLQENKKDPITQAKLTLSELVIKPNLNIAQLCANYKPFFDVLLEERKTRLVEAVLEQKKVESKKADMNGKNSLEFFANPKDEFDNAAKKLEKMELNLECPITHEIMKDPVMLVETGQSYERKALEDWFKKNNTDPLTRKELKDKKFVSNYALKSLCDQARLETKLKM